MLQLICYKPSVVSGVMRLGPQASYMTGRGQRSENLGIDQPESFLNIFIFRLSFLRATFYERAGTACIP